MTKRMLAPLALLCSCPAIVDAFAQPKSSSSLITTHRPISTDTGIGSGRPASLQQHATTTHSSISIGTNRPESLQQHVNSARQGDIALFATPAAKSNVALAGKIAPILSKFALNGKIFSKIGTALRTQTSIVDLIFIALVGWCSQPVFKFVYEKFFESWRKKDWETTYLYFNWKLMSEAARIASIVYAVDCLDIILTVMGINIAKMHNFGEITASVAYTVWAAKKIAKWKQMYLKRAIRKSEGGNKQGRFFLFNRFGDVVISIATILTIADRLHLSKSAAFSRFFALGSVGTLALSLAAKGIAEQFVGGLALSTTDKFLEGDMILLGDGTSGKVIRLGWMSIDLRKSDETIVRIPNSQISNQRITNLSRARLSQVTQTLRVKYTDAEKIPKLLADIKEQVQEDCPKLITDGSRPCRVHFKNFQEDHIEIGVDFRFRVPVVGDGYHQNKEACNLAIAKAMEKNKVQFALPTAFNYEVTLNDYGHLEKGEYTDPIEGEAAEGSA